jgi:Flp pilus assembly CpaE family ATPase
LVSSLSEAIPIPRAFLNFAREYNAHPRPGGKLVVVFSTNGGVGRTTIATNLAVILHEITAEPVVLVDGSLPFGDVALSPNISPEAKTIADPSSPRVPRPLTFSFR